MRLSDPLPDVRLAAQVEKVPTRTPDEWNRMLGACKPSPLLATFAASLGLSWASLLRVGICRDVGMNRWMFPMYDGQRQTIGIRTRFDNGDKASVKGSRSGIFIPTKLATGTLCVVEGPTDCAAALDLGAQAIGRPDCRSAVSHVLEFVSRSKYRTVTIIADNDANGAGIAGAKQLEAELVKLRPTRIVVPDAKDLRAWLAAGLTPERFRMMTHWLGTPF